MGAPPPKGQRIDFVTFAQPVVARYVSDTQILSLMLPSNRVTCGIPNKKYYPPVVIRVA